MRSTVTFLAVLFGLSFFASGAMLVTATLEPQWFMLGKKQAHADSLQARVKKDTASVAMRARADSTADSLRIARASADSADRVRKAKDEETVRTGQAAVLAQAADSASRTDQLRRLAKLYEAMKPDEAAKILSHQPDTEVRAVVLHIKKKQAAKILAGFDPARAAQILAP